MIFGVTTTNHSKRRQYFIDLQKQIQDLGYKLVISVDDGSLGIYGNKKKCRTSALQIAILEGDDCILAEDDIQLCKDFKKYISMLDASYMFYSLFNRLRERKDSVRMGELDLYEKPKNGLYEQAIYIRKENVKMFYEMYMEFWRELPRLQEQDKRQAQHPDQMLQSFLFEKDIKRANVKQSLVEHVGEKSALGHFIGKATIYIDNINK